MRFAAMLERARRLANDERDLEALHTANGAVDEIRYRLDDKIQCLTQPAIALALGLPASALKTRVRRAGRVLRHAVRTDPPLTQILERLRVLDLVRIVRVELTEQALGEGRTIVYSAILCQTDPQTLHRMYLRVRGQRLANLHPQR